MEKTLKCLTEKTDATDYDLRVEVRRLHVALEETKAMFQAAQEHWIHRFDELKWEVSEMKEENQKSEMLVDEAGNILKSIFVHCVCYSLKMLETEQQFHDLASVINKAFKATFGTLHLAPY